MMAVVLENVSMNTVIARTTISAVHRTAHIISSIPNILYHKKAFPDALFHQLLLAMAHPYHETRVGAHCVFSILLMPSLLSPGSDQNKKTSKAFCGFLSVSASKQGRSGSFSFQDEGKDKSDSMDSGLREEGNQILDVAVKQLIVCQSGSQSSSFKLALTDEKMLTSL